MIFQAIVAGCSGGWNGFGKLYAVATAALGSMNATSRSRSSVSTPAVKRIVLRSGFRGLRKSARAYPLASLTESEEEIVPEPAMTLNVPACAGTPFSKASTTRAVIAACRFPPTHGGLLLRRIRLGGPGVTVMTLLVAGAFPASSVATMTIGSAKV